MPQLQITSNAPRPNMLIGITHTPEGAPIIREPKTLKVGIGLPRGKACDVYVNTAGKWIIRSAKKVNGKLQWAELKPLDTRAEAERAFYKAWETADTCDYPRKVPYFQFTRPVMSKEGAEIYVPDFSAIEVHSVNSERKGPPTEIDIIFLSDEPFSGEYQMWSSSELKCHGDGINALRVLALAKTDEERALAKDAAAAGKKHFPVVDGCWTCDCPYSKETVKGDRTYPSPCKPGADIKFQLARNIRVGGTAFYHTSGYRSIQQIFSSIARIKELTGGKIAGIPLKMVVRSHKTNHNGQPAIQQNVSIEFRTEDMESLRRDLIEQVWKFKKLGGDMPAQTRHIEASVDEVETLGTPSLSAQAMADEFYPGASDDDDFNSPVRTGTTESMPETTQAATGGRQRKPMDIPDPVVPAKGNAPQSPMANQQPTATEAKPAATEAKPAAQEPAAQETPVAAEPVATAAEPVAVSAEPEPAKAAPTEVILFPWNSAEEMRSVFKKQIARIGAQEFERIRDQSKLIMGNLDPLSEKALAFYYSLIAVVDSGDQF